MYIVVEGNIGAGKTSLVKKLCHSLAATPMLEEFAENSFLPRFYENPAQFAFPLELSFLAARYQQINKIFENKKDSNIISDYHFEKCRLFASVNLPVTEMELFDTFFKIMYDKMPVPDLLIFLESDTKRLKKNIQIRGRSYETDMDHEYLQKISDAYVRSLNTIKCSKMLNINVSDIDFVHNNVDFEKIFSLVHKQLKH